MLLKTNIEKMPAPGYAAMFMKMKSLLHECGYVYEKIRTCLKLQAGSHAQRPPVRGLFPRCQTTRRLRRDAILGLATFQTSSVSFVAGKDSTQRLQRGRAATKAVPWPSRPCSSTGGTPVARNLRASRCGAQRTRRDGLGLRGHGLREGRVIQPLRSWNLTRRRCAPGFRRWSAQRYCRCPTHASTDN